MAKTSGQTIVLLSVVAGGMVVIGYLLFFYPANGVAGNPEATSRLRLEDIPFDGQRAYGYLKEICAIGTRVSGTPGMQAQQKLLLEYFSKLGGKVQWQQFRVRSPRDGSAVDMANLIVHWHPDRNERILLAAHYDTRPFPDRDRLHPNGTFIGASDGASGVAVLMELGRKMEKLPGKLGVDFVLFDGEELIYSDDDPYFIGSEYFARNYVAEPPGYKYKAAVLLDMVGDADLGILQERNSISWADSKPLVKNIWETARRLGVREFIARPGMEIRDDHLKLHNIAGIPSCDLIDIDYPYWHTEGDTPEHCSALSLAKVGWVIETWLTAAVAKP